MRSTVLYVIVAAAFGLFLSLGCSGGGNPVTPAPAVSPGITGQAASTAQSANSYLLGYYDIYYDIQANEFEAVENRTTSFTLNIVPFLNQMTIPKNGITFDEIVLHQDDPSFLGVDVKFTVYHPFPGYEQYNAYDIRGVLIGNGARTLDYHGLRVAEHGVDLWMKNPDGYTRWFNPTEFTTELIFGYAPGGWQNMAGDANLNPYKYYSKHLDKDQDVWSYLTGDNNWDGIFESGVGREMQIEFPLPPDGIGIMFGYAVVVTWDEQGPTGPYHPVHCPEPVAASVTQTPDAWYNETDGSGGDLILDIDLFAWEYQPSIVRIESTILGNTPEFDFGTYAAPGGEHYSTWHVEAPSGIFVSTEGHDAWIIAEYGGFDYKNGLPEIPSSDGSLAAFFRYDLVILDEPGFGNPVAVAEIITAGPYPEGATIEFDASGSYDTDEGGLSIVGYAWDFDGDSVYGDSYDSGTDENPSVQFTTAGTYYIDVEVTDNEGATDTLNTKLEVEIISVPQDPVAVAEIVTAEPFCPDDPIEFDASGSYDQDEGGDSIVSYEWDFDGDGTYGDSYDSGTDENPVKIFTDFGAYTVDVLVTDDEGATDTLDTPLGVAVGGATWVDDDAVAPYYGTFDNPWPTIQDGIDNATSDCPSGLWVLVKDGTYTENISIPSNMTVEGYSDPAPVIESPTGSSSNLVYFASGSNTTVKHFRIKPMTSANGVQINGSNNTVDDIEFIDNAGGATCTRGVYINGNSLTVNDVRVDGYHKSATGFIYCGSSCKGTTITNCVLLNITFTAASSMNVLFFHNGYSAGAPYGLVAKNVIGHITFSEAFVSTQWVSVVGFEYATGCTFRNNLIFDIDNNLGDTGWTWGIDGYRVVDSVVEHNTISGISGPTWIYATDLSHYNTDPAGTIHRDHIITHLTAGMMNWRWAFMGSWASGTTLPVDYSCTYSVGNSFRDYDEVVEGTGCKLNTNPQFINQYADDYRLSSGSPCANAAHDGTDMGAYGGSDPLTWLPD